MDLEQIITWLESKHCGACKYGQAIKALRDLAGDGMVVNKSVPAPTPPPAPRKSLRSRGAKSDFEKECKTCHVVKPFADFETAKMCKDGHLGTCRECRNKSARKRYSGNGGSGASTSALDQIEASTKALHTANVRGD